MAEETSTPTPEVAPQIAPRPRPAQVNPRTVTVKKFVRDGEPDSGETFQHTLSDFVEELVDVRSPKDPRLTPEQKKIIEERGIVAIPVKKPIVFARDFGYTKNGEPLVSEFADNWTEDKCPECGHDLAETVSGTADKSKGVRCSACDHVWNP